MPKVSIIIPVYGVEKFIERCARSLFEQTLDDIEYLFIDDCTPDRSIEVLKRVLEEYPSRKQQVVIHRMEQNSGQAIVRKWGMLNATGDYVIHCDSDDWVDKDMYYTMYKKAISGKYDIVRCNFVRVSGKKEQICDEIPIEYYSDNHRLVSSALLGESLTSLCDKLVDKRLLRNIIYPINNMYEDAAIVIQLFVASQKVGYIPRAFYKYRQNSMSICGDKSTTSYLNRFNQVCENTNLIISILKNAGLLEKFSEEVDVMKYRAKCHLVGILKYDNYYSLWRKQYSEINSRIMFNTKLRWQDKVKYVLYVIKLLG